MENDNLKEEQTDIHVVISRFILETAKKYNIKNVGDITIRLVDGNIFTVDACEVQMYEYKQSLMYDTINDL